MTTEFCIIQKIDLKFGQTLDVEARRFIVVSLMLHWHDMLRFMSSLSNFGSMHAIGK